MVLLSFVGKSYAIKGFQFFFDDINPECPKDCSLFTTCQKNLEKNKVYEVVETLNKKMNCPKDFHEESMILCKLKEPILLASMYNKDIYEGSIIEFSIVGCERDDCKYFKFCEPHSLLIQNKNKVKIIQTIKKLKDCPKKLNLSVVKLEKK